MNHIYIHIPFCVKKCAYCAFYSVTDLTLIDTFVGVLLTEIDDYARSYGRTELKTVYIGGGTPSLLTAASLSRICDHLQSGWTFAEDIEFSIETNPETVTKETLIEYKNIGINRLSVGIQSFNDDELKYLGRIHGAKKAKDILSAAVNIFDNVNIDLVFGLPNQTKEAAAKNIETAVEFVPKHISHYELTFEEGTPIYNDAVKRDSDDPALYVYTQKLLEKAGYIQYEISNYALAGYECRHNLAYWSDRSYLGLGPAAHSYDREKNIRWAGSGSVSDYVEGRRIGFTEKAEDIDKIIMGLRKTAGMTADSIPERYRNVILNLIEDGMLKKNRNMISFTSRGALLANRVLLEISGAENRS